MRALIAALFRLALRIFFRRLEMTGVEGLPDGPLVFALNHPNALVDPLFLLCEAPRPVSFLAKEPLFRMPFVGFLVRHLDALPVYRQQDGADPAKNRETFCRAREILAGGGAIAIFPEGTTHSAPHLLPVKTGAARIALGAASDGAGCALHVVPTGLYYTEKGLFRSRALVVYGDAIPVAPGPVGDDGEPPREAVRALSARMEEGLRAVTLNAEDARTLHLVAVAERIFSADAAVSTLRDEFALRQRILEGYAWHRSHSADCVAPLERRILRYEADLRQAGLEPRQLLAEGYAPGRVLREALRWVARFLLLLAPAAVGIVLHYPSYRLVGSVAARVAKDDETAVSTVKILAAMLFFPLTWLLAAGAVARWGSPAAALGTLAAAPLTAWAALTFVEHLERFGAAARALLCFRERRGSFARLAGERQAIKAEILRLAETLGAVGSAPEPSGSDGP